MSNEKSVLDQIKEEKLEVIDAGFRTFRVDIKRVLKEEGQRCFGLTDFDNGVVSLDKDMNPQLARETLLHELTHIVLELCGLGGEETTGVVRETQNEELTTLISRSMLLLMNLNPALFKMIVRDKDVR
jgi:Zn-dependent peptidase ImmA (M78 family)